MTQFTFTSDEVALVTGGATGLGRALVRLLKADGVQVVSLDRRAEHEPGAHAIECDITDEPAVQAAVNSILADFGRIDAVANSAALVGTVVEAPLLEHTGELFRRVVDVNLTGQFFVLREAARAMRERNVRGRIVNIASVRGILGGERIVSYCAAKAGLLGLTRAAAIELAPFGIRVNAVAPGPIATELALAEAGDAEPWRLEKPVPLPGWATPEEVARLVAVLMSVDSGFVTGATYPVDGGLTAY